MDKTELLPNVENLLKELKANKIKIGLGSASKNAPYIINKTGIVDYFEAVVSGGDVVHSKPHPEVFLNGAAILNVEPRNTIVFEDSQKGIEAAQRGGFICVGVGSENDLQEADIVIKGFESISLQDIIYQLSQL